MSKYLQIIGGAGTGKTTTLLNTMDKVLQTGTADPYTIGFVSFTRAARREAAERAASRFDLCPDSLEQSGWFRTLHSVCYHQLGNPGGLLTDDRKDRKWLSELFGEKIDVEPDPDAPVSRGERSDAAVALSLWAAARSRLVPFQKVWERASFCDAWTPDLQYCKNTIDKYEQAKRLDGRCDFTDLLARYAGYRCGFDGADDHPPEGSIPQVPVWFLDESQDQSALSDAVARRITSDAKWVYLVGDPFQAIYGFAGADPALFQAWTTDRKILGQSYRCPAAVMSLGEDILRRCSDYWDRGILPAKHDGSVDTIAYESSWTSDLDPNQSWLLLARTNHVASRLCKRLDGNGLPWVSTRQNSKWSAPDRNRATLALDQLQKLGIVYAKDWRLILKYIPSKSDGKELLEHGTKARWDRFDGDDDLTSTNVADWGATSHFCSMIKSGAWRRLVDNADQLIEAVSRWGEDWVWNGTGIKVSTIHGAKGMEADNVLLLTTTSQQVAKSAEDQQGRDEELRLAYVGVTRARKRLFIAEENTRYRMEVA